MNETMPHGGHCTGGGPHPGANPPPRSASLPARMRPLPEGAELLPARLEQLLEAAGDGVVVLDREGRPTWLNASAERLLGLSRAALPDGSLWAEPSPLQTPELARGCRRAAEGGTPVTVKEYLAPRDAWVEARISPSPAGLLVLLRDVTEVEHALGRAERFAEDLRHKEARFRSFLESTSVVLWVTDASGHFQADSPSWCAFTGQSGEKWRDGSGWLEAIHPQDRALASAAWKRAFESRGVYEVEYRLRRVDGSYTPVLSRGVPVLEPDGTVREWVGAITDITAQRRAHQALELLAEAGVALTSSLEPRLALERLARCVVPGFAEWCAVYLRATHGALERVACVDQDTTRALRMRTEGLDPEDGPHDPRRVVETGELEHFRPLAEQFLYGQEQSAARRALRFTFAGLRGMTVPLTLNGQVLGAITFAAGRGYRPYDAEDQRLAVELAHRAAVAIEHSHLLALPPPPRR